VGVNTYVSFANARLTKDVDFAVAKCSRNKCDQIAKDIRKEFGPVRFGMMRDHKTLGHFVPSSEEVPYNEAVMFAGRGQNIAVDLILPKHIWVEKAVKFARQERNSEQNIFIAQKEELIAAKIISFADTGNRMKDLEDLKNLIDPSIDINRVLSSLAGTTLQWRSHFQGLLPSELLTRIWNKSKK